MRKKWTLEEVRKSFESEGYTLLTTNYKNNRQKLDYICPKRHKHSISWDNWRLGQRCGICFGSKKLSIEKVKGSFAKENYTLLSDKYENNFKKLKFRCPKGHEHSITWNDWQQGSRCGICCGSPKKTLEEVRKSFESEGYILLTNEYKNNRQKLDYICPKGHKYSISYSNWKTGYRCGICFGNIKLTLDKIRKSFEKEKYVLLSKEYKNANSKLKFKCPNNHIHFITWGSWQQGQRCGICFGPLKKTIEEVRKSFESEGYTLLSKEYKNSIEKLNYICPKGHKHSIIWNGWQQGSRCRICSPQTSKAEQEIYELLKSHFLDAVNNDRTVLSPLELDIFIPSKSLAIEYCGLYWHSESNLGKRYHIKKLERCQKKNIQLITIFEDEWINKKDITLSRLKYICDIIKSKKVYARQCVIREINQGNKNIFLNKFHILGTDKSLVNLGLFFNDELVSVMTFSKPSIAKGNNPNQIDVYELNRFCSDSEYIAIGGASKLFKYFIKTYNPKYIYSYSDRRWSDGNLYKILGFKFQSFTQPNYWYIKPGKYFRLHRFQFRKSMLSKKLDNFDLNLTEWENMKNNGYDRIWDCGHAKWIYKL